MLTFLILLDWTLWTILGYGLVVWAVRRYDVAPFDATDYLTLVIGAMIWPFLVPAVLLQSRNDYDD